MIIKFHPSTTPTGKLADAELEFLDGPLAGLRLTGFAVWQRRTGDRHVTFPSRHYTVNGEHRTVALLRPATGDLDAADALRHVILDAFHAGGLDAQTEAN